MPCFGTYFLLCCASLVLLAVDVRAQDVPGTARNSPSTVLAGADPIPVQLPASVGDLCVAGSGRYLLASLPDVKKLAVIDVAAGKLVKYLPFPGDILFAGGAEKFFVVLKGESVIQRWDLETLERELSVPLPVTTPSNLVIGHASLGPVFLGNFLNNFQLLDPHTLRPWKLDRSELLGRGFDCAPTDHVRASANGRLFVSRAMGLSSAGISLLRLHGRKPELLSDSGISDVVTLSADGRRIYSRGELHSEQLRSLLDPRAGLRDEMWMASITGDFVVSFGEYHSRELGKRDLVISLAGADQPLITAPKIAPSPQEVADEEGKLTLDKRVMFFPEQSKLVVLARTLDRFEFWRVDVEAALKRSGIDYLYFASQPPLTVEVGKRFRYLPVVKSKAGGAKVTVDSGPSGMEADVASEVTWSPTAADIGEHLVILASMDKSGRKVFQTFTLFVANIKAAGANIGPAPPATADRAGDALFPGGARTVKLPAPASRAVAGGGGQYLVVHLPSLRKLAVIDLVAAKIIGYVPAEDDQVDLAAGAEKLVLWLGKQKTISRWDMRTLQRELNVTHKGQFGSMLMGSDSQGPVLVIFPRGPASEHFAYFLDLETLSEITAGMPERGVLEASEANTLGISANGRTAAPLGGCAIVNYFEGKLIVREETGEPEPSLGLERLLPSPDGSVFYHGPVRIRPDFEELAPEPGGDLLLPATRGKYYLNVDFASDVPGQKVGVKIDGCNGALVTFDDIDVLGVKWNDFNHRKGVPLEERFVLAPHHNLLALVHPKLDQVEVRPLNIEQALAKAEFDYLFVTSIPPTEATAGDAVRYQLAVQSKKGGVKYRLATTLPAMQLSQSGLFTWKATPGQHSVSIVVSDAAGQEARHDFLIHVERGRTGGAMPPGPPTVEGVEPSSPFARLIGQVRVWTDSKSGRKLEGRLVEVSGGSVKVAVADGRQLLIPLDRLSREDLLWLVAPAGGAASEE